VLNLKNAVGISAQFHIRISGFRKKCENVKAALKECLRKAQGRGIRK
jgi:hypothetical protein